MVIVVIGVRVLVSFWIQINNIFLNFSVVAKDLKPTRPKHPALFVKGSGPFVLFDVVPGFSDALKLGVQFFHVFVIVMIVIVVEWMLFELVDWVAIEGSIGIFETASRSFFLQRLLRRFGSGLRRFESGMRSYSAGTCKLVFGSIVQNDGVKGG